MIGKFNSVIIIPTSQDDLTNHYHYLHKKLVMTYIGPIKI